MTIPVVFHKPPGAPDIFVVPLIVHNNMDCYMSQDYSRLWRKASCVCGAKFEMFSEFKNPITGHWKTVNQIERETLQDLQDMEVLGWGFSPGRAKPHQCPQCNTNISASGKVVYDSFLSWVFNEEQMKGQDYFAKLSAIHATRTPTPPAAGTVKFRRPYAYNLGLDMSNEPATGADREQFILMEQMLKGALQFVYDGATMPDTLDVDVRLNLGDIRKLKKFIVTEDDDVQDTE